jgi:integrase
MHIQKVYNKGNRLTYRCRIEKEGKRFSKTFQTKREANAWGNDQEDNLIVAKKTLYDAFDKYLDEYIPTLKGDQPARSRMRSLRKNLPNILLIDFNEAAFTRWKVKRAKEIGEGSLVREAGTLSHVFKMAVGDWHWLAKNPLPKISRPKEILRKRGIKEDEINQIILNLEKSKHGPQVTILFKLAIETAMRLSELLGLTWANVYEKYVFLPDTKNGDSRKVPLTIKARGLIAARKGFDPNKVFTLSRHVASQTFARHSDGIHFHDARGEAITRMSKKLTLLELTAVSGHRSAASLSTYYSDDVEATAAKLG